VDPDLIARIKDDPQFSELTRDGHALPGAIRCLDGHGLQLCPDATVPNTKANIVTFPLRPARDTDEDSHCEIPAASCA